MHARRSYGFAFGLTLSLATLTGCADPKAMDEVREGQREIKAKLADLEKKIDAIASRPAAPAAPSQPDPNKVYDIAVGDSPVKGPADARVTLVEFADFQCPFCSSANTLVHQVLEAFPKDVKFVYKEFPLTQIHPNALPASKAAQAAKLQGKYWEMHDKLFDNAKTLDGESLKKYAQEIGLDVAKWEKDMASPEVQKAIQDDMKAASAADVRGTPSIFVNGKRVTNRSLDGIKQMVNDALQQKKG